MSENNTRLCIDCKFYSMPLLKHLGGYDARCTKDSVESINLVNGKLTRAKFIDMDRCRSNRSKDYVNDENQCGPDGKYWIPKEDTPANLLKLLSK